jgi:predicted amidophosphoribosyltransferase
MNAVSGKSIILIDDVLTTGNTVNECSRVLKEAGAIEVMVAVIASGRTHTT